MITRNDWLKSNIVEEPHGDLKVWFEPKPFKGYSNFDAAALFTAYCISNDHPGRDLYLALSGGADSEYVWKTFREAGVKITPIVVETPMNHLEVEYAARLDRKYGIKPIVLKMTELDIENYYFEMIHKQMRSKSLNCVYQMIAVAKANALGGIVVTGDNLISDTGNLVSDSFEYFADVLYKDSIGFYYYTQALTYAMVHQIRAGETCPDYKERVYKTIWRPKFIPQYSEDFMNRYYNIAPEPRGSEVVDHGSVADFLKMMENYVS